MKVSSTVSYRKSVELIGKVMKILDRGMRPTRSLQEPTNFSNEKMFFEGSKQI